MTDATSARRTPYVDPQRPYRLLRTADVVVLFLVTMLVFLGSSLAIPPDAVPLVGFLALEVAVVSVLIMGWLGLYDLALLRKPGRGIISAMVTTMALGAIVFAATHFGVFRLEPVWLSVWLVLCLMHVTLTRTGAGLWARSKAVRGGFRRHMAIVGGGRAADEAVRLLETSDNLDIQIVGVWDDRRDSFEDLAGAARDGRLDMIVLAIPMSADARLLKALQRLWPLPVDIRISAQMRQLKLSPRAFTYMGKLPLLSIFDRSLNARFRCKDVLDRAAAALLLAVMTPVMALAAAAIWLESGRPVLIRRQRYGFDRQPIPVWTFRCSRNGSDGAAPAFTRVGRCLHAVKLDGLPQLFTVLAGGLSLVGPRPRATGSHSAAALYHRVIDGYFARHRLKPGLTGWAQINDWRGQTWTREALENRVKHDLEYVDRWSLFFDLYILLKTPFALLRSAEAAGS